MARKGGTLVLSVMLGVDLALKIHILYSVGLLSIPGRERKTNGEQEDQDYKGKNKVGSEKKRFLC